MWTMTLAASPRSILAREVVLALVADILLKLELILRLTSSRTDIIVNSALCSPPLDGLSALSIAIVIDKCSVAVVHSLVRRVILELACHIQDSTEIVGGLCSRGVVRVHIHHQAVELVLVD